MCEHDTVLDNVENMAYSWSYSHATHNGTIQLYSNHVYNKKQLFRAETQQHGITKMQSVNG